MHYAVVLFLLLLSSRHDIFFRMRAVEYHFRSSTRSERSPGDLPIVYVPQGITIIGSLPPHPTLYTTLSIRLLDGMPFSSNGGILLFF